MPKISLKGKNLPTSPIRKLSKYATDAKAKGIDVIHLNIGQPDIETPAKALQAIQSFDENVLAYGPSEGSLAFRQKMCFYLTRLAKPLASHPRITALPRSFLYAWCLWLFDFV